MTHDEYKSLVIKVADEIRHIENYQHYLKIALEQFNNSDVDSFLRVELLVTTYLSAAECSLDQLNSDIKKLRRVCHNKLTQS